MFDAEDDVSFEDPLFLQEVVRFSDSSSASHSESTPCFQDNYSDGINNNFPLRNASGNSCGVKNNVNENRVESKEKQKEKTTLKFIYQKCGYMEKFAADNSFEFDDDLFDNDIEHKVNKKSCVTSTPPDSEFTQSLISNTCKQVEINKDKSNSATNSDVVRGNNFRSRILQTLKENNLVSSLSCKPSFSSQSEAASSNTYLAGTQSNDRKRASPDLSDINEEDGSPIIKKLYTQFRIPSNSYAESLNYSKTVNNTTGENEQIHSHPLSNNQSKTNAARDDPVLGCQQPSSSSTTPVKPPVNNIRKTVSPGGPLIRKRKFPGPAGMLPQLGSDVAAPNLQQLHEKETPSSVAQEVVCSQNFVDDFSRGPWKQMMNDLELDQTDPVSPLQVFNIKWLLRRASLRGKAGVRKVPFLAVIVRNLDVTHSDATTVLRDPTGEMNGTIASSVIDEYGPSLQPGSVLLLRGVTVLSPVGLRTAAGLREHTRRHYLNITLNTVLSIYTADESGHVITTSVGNFDKKELCKQAAAPETAGGPRAIIEEEEEEEHGDFSAQSHSLFSNITDSHSQFRQSTNLSRIPNYRSPRAASNNVLHCNAGQPQKCPQVNNKQLTSPLSSNKPTIDSTRFDGTIMGPGTPTTVQHLQPRFQQSLIKSVVSFTSKSPSGSSSNTLQNKNMKKFPNFKKLSDHAEENEISDLLDGVDADSLFGDF